MVYLLCIFLLIVSLFFSQTLASNQTSITVGIIAYGNGTVKKEVLSKHDHDLMVVKYLVNTKEISNVVYAVRQLDNDGSVDAILILDYDTSILKMAHFFTPKHKRLIKLGANPLDTWTRPEKKLQTTVKIRSCEITHNGLSDVYCLDDINGTSIDRDEFMMELPGTRAIRNLVSSFKWKRVIIFYETSTEDDMTALVDGLSLDRVLVALFNVEHVANLHEILQQIYTSSIKSDRGINVIVLCRYKCVGHIMYTANRFDTVNSNKTLLKKFAKWLVLFYGQKRDSILALQKCSNDLDNVAIISIPEFGKIGIEMMNGLIESSLLDALKEQLTIKSQKKFKNDFLTNLVKNAKDLDPTSKCKAYHIDTLLWTRDGRRFSSVGYTDTKGNVVVKSDVFPNVKYGYNKRRFLVSTLPYSPFIIKREVNNSYLYEGFCMDLLNELAQKLNFTYTLTEPADRNWGTFTDEAKTTFNGLVGQLQRKEVDIVAAPITRQAQRSPAMEFSYSYFYEYTTVLIRKPDVNSGKWKTLVDPLRGEVLVTIVLLLFIVTFLVFILEKNNPFYDSPQHARERMAQGGLHELHSSFWYVFGALLCQGGVHLPLSTSGRTLISCWWLTCIIIVGTYCGNLIAFLTVTKEQPPFNTIAEMLELKDTYKWGTVGGTNWEMVFPTSSNPTFREVGEAFLEFNKADPTILHQIPEFHINRVLTDKNYAWIGDKTYMEIYMAKECSLLSIKEEFMPMIYVFGFTKNSPHTAIFSEQMLKIHEGGLFQIWKRKWWPKSNFCEENSIPEAKPISLMDVQSAFYVCVIGIFIGIVAFAIELIVHYYRSRKNLNCTKSNHDVPKSGDDDKANSKADQAEGDK